MSHVSVTRKDLPYLEVESIEDGPIVPATDEEPERPTWLIRGRVRSLGAVVPGDGCWLLGPGRSAVYGDWLQMPGENGVVEFQTIDDPGVVSAGARMALAASKGWVAMLVEDGPSAWKKETFVPKSAIITRFVDGKGQGWRELRPISEGTEISPDAEVIADAWDHEHCALCHEHIDSADQFFLHKEENMYLCVSCFDRYVSNGDISFLVDCVAATDDAEDE